jgi:nucleoside-diphosphate-sugar epimerase
LENQCDSYHSLQPFYGGEIIGKERGVDRVLGSLNVDRSKIRQELDWIPPYTLDEGLAITSK